MDTSFVYVIISLIIMEFEPCHGNPVRRTRIAMDTDDDELSRKIVPKSVFTAPLYTCPPGYAQNDDGDCLRIIRVSQNTQMDFILSRLRSIVDSNGEIIIRSKIDNRQHSIKARPAKPSTPPPQNSIRPIRKHRTDTNEPVKIQIQLFGKELEYFHAAGTIFEGWDVARSRQKKRRQELLKSQQLHKISHVSHVNGNPIH